MLLIGCTMSPFVRRVAVSFNQLGIAFDHRDVNVWDAQELIGGLNPLKRMPVLVLDDEEVLMDSAIMLEYADEQVGPDRALMPAGGPRRRMVQRLSNLAIGAMEKSVAAYYEANMRPAEKVHQPWRDHLEGQVMSALTALEDVAREAGESYLIHERLSQADVSAAVVFTCLAEVHPHLDVVRRFPMLRRHAEMMEEHAAFRNSPPSWGEKPDSAAAG